jgi:hypothetical protein
MAVLTMEHLRQPVATHGKQISLVSAVLAAVRFAADCHRLQPRGSIKAPPFVAGSGYVRWLLLIGGPAP